MKSRKHHRARRSVHERAEHRAKRRFLLDVRHGQQCRACYRTWASPPAMPIKGTQRGLRHALSFLTYHSIKEVLYGRTATQ